MDSIRNFLQETLEKEKIAGMTVAVTDRNGLLFSEGFGVESVERPEVKTAPDALFRIASISKVVTGMTILSLVEEGLLSLDESVKKYLPWLTLRDKETEAGVTLGHLLSHTSGLPTEYTPDGYREESALEPSLRAGLPELELLFPLGRGYNYSNWGIRLASLVAEAVTGKKFTQLAQERVLTPLPSPCGGRRRLPCAPPAPGQWRPPCRRRPRHQRAGSLQTGPLPAERGRGR